jgi:O-antigen ligase
MRFALLNDGQYYYAQLQMKGYKDIDFEDAHITFRIKPDGICAMSAAGNEFMMTEVAHTGFERHQRFGSGRGYLWSRTFPLLKDRILIGSGADTFPLVFPQGDYAGQYNAQYPIGTIVDKPHNMFLGTWVGTGLISLLAQLAIYGIYMVQSFRLYFRRDLGDDLLSFAGAGIFFGVTAFVATGLVNDSTISVMPMFYALLGMGEAINFMIRKRSVTKA